MAATGILRLWHGISFAYHFIPFHYIPSKVHQRATTASINISFYAMHRLGWTMKAHAKAYAMLAWTLSIGQRWTLKRQAWHIKARHFKQKAIFYLVLCSESDEGCQRPKLALQVSAPNLCLCSSREPIPPSSLNVPHAFSLFGLLSMDGRSLL